MSYPKAYAPVQGQRYQLLVRTPHDRAYEHCDYATSRKELKRLIEEYRLAYGGGYEFKSILLPQKYWSVESVK